MEEKINIIPTNFFVPYTNTDVSVIIPQASQYVRRIKWFLPQYIDVTPPEVVKNTLVVYDPEDLETKKILDDCGIQGITATPPHSTYKLQAGFSAIKTRLCVRMHNDAMIKRSDWVDVLVEQFNKERHAQIIGAVNRSGTVSKETIDQITAWYPSFGQLSKNLVFSEGDHPIAGTSFLSAFFIAGQTHLFRGLYPLVVYFNDGKMDKEDVLFTLFASLFHVKITNWTNMFQFVKDAGSGYGDFDEGFIPLNSQHIVTNDNRSNFPKAEFL